MRVLILGAGGMLGHKLFQVFSRRFETYGTIRKPKQVYEKITFFDSTKLLDCAEVTDFEALKTLFTELKPDVVINAVGIVKQLEEGKNSDLSITINALLPHRLSKLCRDINARLIHFSTDCVFSGGKGDYREDDIPDARDLYGLTKYLGEVNEQWALTIRTSIIGHELTTQHGLVEWFLNEKSPSVKGFRRAIFSGFPTVRLASILADVIVNFPELCGIYHIASQPIDKYNLLLLLKEFYNVKTEVIPYDDFVCDRSLNNNRFQKKTGFSCPSWRDLIAQMVADSSVYD